MNKTELINKITKIPVSQLKTSELQIILRLVTILATTHLANKIDKIIRKIESSDKANDIINILK